MNFTLSISYSPCPLAAEPVQNTENTESFQVIVFGHQKSKTEVPMNGPFYTSERESRNQDLLVFIYEKSMSLRCYVRMAKYDIN